MPKVAIEIGERFGKLVVVREEAVLRKGARQFLCHCDCGGEKLCIATRLKTGMNKSCGCMGKGNSRGNPNLTRRSHGESRGPNGKPTPEYVAWMQAIARCHNPNNHAYDRYGGRGILVCATWRGSYEAFLADMGRKPSPKHSLDRIDVNGGYEPDNCRWATALTQARNSRKNRWVELAGRKMCLSEACLEVGLPYDTVRARLTRGWSDERALGVV
jgi:hypothetical protein